MARLCKKKIKDTLFLFQAADAILYRKHFTLFAWGAFRSNKIYNGVFAYLQKPAKAFQRNVRSAFRYKATSHPYTLDAQNLLCTFRHYTIMYAW